MDFPPAAVSGASAEHASAACANTDVEVEARIQAVADLGLDACPGRALPHTAAAVQQVHSSLWRAHQLGGGNRPTVSTGYAALDAELPGGGWPHGVLTELLLPHPGVGEMRLLAPALAAISAGSATAQVAAPGRCVMLFDPPATLAGWVLGQLGVDLQQLLIVHGREGSRGAVVLRRLLPSADLLWAMEQALKSGHVGAVLAWPPDRLRADATRRLQLAAAHHEGPVFLFRDIRQRLQASPAPLRLALHSSGPGEVSVQVLKRRGPAQQRPVSIGLPPVLPMGLEARWRISPSQPSRHAPPGPVDGMDAMNAELALRAEDGTRRHAPPVDLRGRSARAPAPESMRGARSAPPHGMQRRPTPDGPPQSI